MVQNRRYTLSRKTIQRPKQQQIESALTGGFHHPTKLGAFGRGGSADLIDVYASDLPRLPSAVLA
jgi:hypothetical protein